MNLKGWAAIDATTASSRIECVYFGYSRNVSFDMTTGRGGAANGELLRVSGVDSYMVMPVPLPANWKGYGGYYNFSDHRSGVPGRNVLGGIADQFQAGPASRSTRCMAGCSPIWKCAAAPARVLGETCRPTVRRVSPSRSNAAPRRWSRRLA